MLSPVWILGLLSKNCFPFIPSFVYIAEVFILEITCEPTVRWDYAPSDWHFHTGTIVLQEQMPTS